MICDKERRGDRVVNINKLKGKVVENGVTLERLAAEIGMDRATMYRKIKAGGENFSIKEADLIVKSLRLNKEEAVNIFFSQYVA
jgi:hypothetical protein|nr:XRE family transcriptional regulator [Enterocloster bolteae]